MLTGDKKETAVNLAQAAGLLNAPCRVTDLCGLGQEQLREVLRERQRALSDPLSQGANASKNCSLVVDGKTLQHILSPDDGDNGGGDEGEEEEAEDLKQGWDSSCQKRHCSFVAENIANYCIYPGCCVPLIKKVIAVGTFHMKTWSSNPRTFMI